MNVFILLFVCNSGVQGNYKRLAVMKNAENVPPVYEIIWQSDGNYEQLGQRQTRFFSSGKGTDAEQEKVRVWNGMAR